MSERRMEILAEVRERRLVEEFADAIAATVLGDGVGVCYSAIECDPFHDGSSGHEVILRLLAVTDQEVEAAMALLPPRRSA